MNVTPGAHTPPDTNAVRVNELPRSKLEYVIGPVYYVLLAVVLHCVCAGSVGELITNEWGRRFLFAVVAFFYIHSLVSAARAYRTTPLKIPLMYSLNSLSCISLYGFPTLTDRVLAANMETLEVIGKQIYNIYGAHMRMRTLGNMARICRTCEIVQPARTYHCSFCDRCVYRLDHHSPLLGACVHYRNAKYVTLAAFCNFILALVMSLIQVIPTARVTWALFYHREWISDPLYQVCLLAFLIATIYFTIQHLKDAFTSYTKNSLKFERTVLFADFGPFVDRSALDNTRSSIGSPVWKWFVPIDCTKPEINIYRSLKIGNRFPYREEMDGRIRHITFRGAVGQRPENPENLL